MSFVIPTDVKALGKVAVLMGGRSAEREISLRSGNGVLQALRSQGVDAHPFDPAERELAELKREGFDRCFVALHGRYGEDGTVQGALELLGIPYTGSGVMASSVGMDKVMTKRIWLHENLPTPRYLQRPSRALRDPAAQQALAEQAVAELGLPMIVKAPHEGSSIGVYKVHDLAETLEAIRQVAAIDNAVLCENLIVGEELTCPILGTGDQARALPMVRIVAPGGDYNYEQKYFTDEVQYQCPSGLPAELEALIQKEALEAYLALGCRGWGRVDVMLRAEDQQPFLLEINTSPGMTDHSLVPMSARVSGIDYPQLCLLLLAWASLDNQPAAGA
ncbi:D-alanine--D-alanine ligase [Brachymonas sp. G13]|uniref:D-alanine--D-alanine ligase n=1 Tax=Brachymonas wangyanguii TaxID=3130163 RepID=UPI00307DC31A